MLISLNEIPADTKPFRVLHYTKINPVCLPVTSPAKNKTVFYRMIKTCLDDKGIGLAAPQVGIQQRFFIIQDLHIQEWFQVYFNPSWTFLDKEKIVSVEGCLSVPGKEYGIKRYKSIVAKYKTLEEDQTTPGLYVFKDVEEQITDYRAIIFQHEFDHLSGKSIADKPKK